MYFDKASIAVELVIVVVKFVDAWGTTKKPMPQETLHPATINHQHKSHNYPDMAHRFTRHSSLYVRTASNLDDKLNLDDNWVT